MGSSEDCDLPRLSLGLAFTSATGLPANSEVIELRPPPHVRTALRAVCTTAINGADRTANLVGEGVSAVGDVFKAQRDNIIQTLGAVQTVNWEQVPAGYRDLLLSTLNGLPSNAYGGGLYDMNQTYASKAASAVASKAANALVSQGLKKYAWWVRFEGDIGIVFWPGPNNTLKAVAGTLNWAVP